MELFYTFIPFPSERGDPYFLFYWYSSLFLLFECSNIDVKGVKAGTPGNLPAVPLCKIQKFSSGDKGTM